MRMAPGQHLAATFRGLLALPRPQLVIHQHIGDFAARIRFRMGLQDWNGLLSFIIRVKRFRFQKKRSRVSGVHFQGALD